MSHSRLIGTISKQLFMVVNAFSGHEKAFLLNPYPTKPHPPKNTYQSKPVIDTVTAPKHPLTFHRDKSRNYLRLIKTTTQ